MSQTDLPLSIAEASRFYLESVKLARSANTTRTYANGMRVFLDVLAENGLDFAHAPVNVLPEDAVVWLITALKDASPSTERLYLTATTGFYEFLVAENLAQINLPRLRLLISRRARRPGVRLPQFPRSAIETVLAHAIILQTIQTSDITERLRNLRDRAFIITLADTGLRVHEACALRRGDLDWNEGRAIIIGKGDKQAVVRFSRRALSALRDYLAERSQLDGKAGKSLSALPLFARHDKGAGKKVKSISTASGRNIINQRVVEALGKDALGTITPHSFRHYFVTTALRASGNLKLAQELARHENIAVTQRYAHLSDDELDRGYHKIFEDDPDGE